MLANYADPHHRILSDALDLPSSETGWKRSYEYKNGPEQGATIKWDLNTTFAITQVHLSKAM